MLCGLENVSEIYDWAKAAPVRTFLQEQLEMYLSSKKSATRNKIKTSYFTTKGKPGSHMKQGVSTGPCLSQWLVFQLQREEKVAG